MTKRNRIAALAATGVVAAASFGILTSPGPRPTRGAGVSTSPGHRLSVSVDADPVYALTQRKAGGGQQEYWGQGGCCGGDS